MSTNDSWNLYVDTRDRFIELLRSLDVEQGRWKGGPVTASMRSVTNG